MIPANVILSYIDPFSGSILLQLVIAGVIGTIGFSRNAIRNLFLKVVKRGRPVMPPGEPKSL